MLNPKRDARDSADTLEPDSEIAAWLEWARARAARLERRAIRGEQGLMPTDSITSRAAASPVPARSVESES